MKNKCCERCWGYDGTFYGCKDRHCKCHQTAMEECARCGLPKSEWNGRWEKPLCKVGKTTHELHTLATPATTEKDLERAIDDCQNELFQTASNSTDRDFNARLNIQRNVLEKHFRQLLDHQKAVLVAEVEGEFDKFMSDNLYEAHRELWKGRTKDFILSLLRREER